MTANKNCAKHKEWKKRQLLKHNGIMFNTLRNCQVVVKGVLPSWIPCSNDFTLLHTLANIWSFQFLCTKSCVMLFSCISSCLHVAAPCTITLHKAPEWCLVSIVLGSMFSSHNLYFCTICVDLTWFPGCIFFNIFSLFCGTTNFSS